MSEGKQLLTVLGANDLPEIGYGPGPVPRIESILIKPASAVCNLDCEYCFYLDRDADPYKSLPQRQMSTDTLERLVDTYLFYSYPNSVFAFQGGEPTLCGLPFFEKLVGFQQHYGRSGQNVSNSMQTNGVLLTREWCQLFRQYNFLIGISIDGPEEIHDRYRVNKARHGTWKQVMNGIRVMQEENVEFNALCVLSEANVDKPKELYQFFKSLGVSYIQFIPLAEFQHDGARREYTLTAEQYGRFLCEMFDLWWPDRRKVRIRFYDNLAEAWAGQRPGSCTLHESCDSYCVVEYNGDVFPCDFFVEGNWKLGNITLDSWAEIARRARRRSFASKKSLKHPECQACEWQDICHGGCPKFRHGPHQQFEDLDYFCEAYKMIYKKAAGPLREDLRKLLGHSPQRAARVLR